MGAGKTTVGRPARRDLARTSARDTDHDVEAPTGRSDRRHLRRLRRGGLPRARARRGRRGARDPRRRARARRGRGARPRHPRRCSPATRSSSSGSASPTRSSGSGSAPPGRCCSATSAAGSRPSSTSAPRSTSRSRPWSSTPTDAAPEEVADEIVAALARKARAMSTRHRAPGRRRVAVRRRRRPRPRRPAAGAARRRRRSGSRSSAPPAWPTGRPVVDALAATYDVLVLPLPDGERAKTAAVAASCWEALGEAGFTRSDAVVTFGGGATTDLGGFVAATWLRGVRVVHVPDHPARHGRRRGRRQDRHQHRQRQEPRRLLPRARRRALRPGHAATPAARPSWSPGSARSSSAASSPTRPILDLVEAHDAADARRRLAGAPRAGRARDPGQGRRRGRRPQGDRRRRRPPRPRGPQLRPHDGARDRAHRGLPDPARRGGRDRLRLRRRARRAAPATWPPRSWRGTTRASRRSGCPRRTPRRPSTTLHAAMKVDKKARGSQLRFVVLADLARPTVLAGPSESDLRAAYAAIGGAVVKDARPQRAQPGPARPPAARDLRPAPPTPSSPTSAWAGAVTSASRSRCARPTTRARCSTGSTPPPTTATRSCSTPPRGRTTPTRSSTPARSSTAPLVEVHISDPHQRPEEFRHTSVVTPYAVEVVAGHGIDGYRMALEVIARS